MQRVTTLGSTESIKDWMAAAGRQQAESQKQVATGVRFERASEGPADAAAVLRNQRSLDRLAQLQRNAVNAKLWMDSADTALTDAVSSVIQARTLAVQGANDTNSPEARAAIAANLRSVSAELISLANSSVNGRPIFAGTADTSLAYDASGTFQGDAGLVLRSVTTTDSFSVAASGPVVFGTTNVGNPLEGTVFQMINDVAAAVESGDVARTRLGMEALDKAISRIQGELGRIGGLSSRLGEIDGRNQESQIATRAQISEVRDVDMADAIIRLRSAETSYEATLSAASRSLGRSLLDFLR